MEWFTLGPKALEQLRTATGVLRQRLGTSHAAEKVQAMDEEELLDFVNEVLALMDQSESILSRVRDKAPDRLKKPLPNPWDVAQAAESDPTARELRATSKLPRAFEPSEPQAEPTLRELRPTRRGLPNPFARRSRRAGSESGRLALPTS